MSIEAMKQALEALQFALHVGFDESSESQIKKGDKAGQQHRQAITSLRQAIAEAEKQEPVAWMHNHIKGNVIAHRPATLDRHPEHWTALYPEPKPCPTCEALARTVMLDQTSHDTSPPQRQWVGLTDEQKVALCKQFPDNLTFNSINAVEAKLKEKNNG